MNRLLAIVVAGACAFGCGTTGAPSDNPLPGGNLAYVDQTGRLAITQVNGGNTKFLSSATGTALDPAITRDGKTIAFAYDPAGENSAHLSIYSVSTEMGAMPMLLAQTTQTQTFSSPTWDRESQKIYFVAFTGGTSSILWVPAAGGMATTLNTDIGGAALIKSLALIDDNTLLVSTGNSGQLSKLDITTGVSTVIPNLSAPSRAGVSHDGTKIAFVTTTGVQVFTLATSQVLTLDTANATTDKSPAFSPDDSFLVFDDGTKLYVADAVTGATRQQVLVGTRADWGS